MISFQRRLHPVTWLLSSAGCMKAVGFFGGVFFGASHHMMLFWFKTGRLHCPCFTLSVRTLVQGPSLFLQHQYLSSIFFFSSKKYSLLSQVGQMELLNQAGQTTNAVPS